MAKLLITIGLILVVTGLLWPWLLKLGIGKLPGDIVLERGNFKFYAPITTSIVISILISIVIRLFPRL